MKTTLRLLGCVVVAGLLGGCIAETAPDIDPMDAAELNEATSVPPIGPVIPCGACDGSLDVTSGEVMYDIPNALLPSPTLGDVELNPVGEMASKTYPRTVVSGGAVLFVPVMDQGLGSATITFTGADGHRYSFGLMLISTVPQD